MRARWEADRKTRIPVQKWRTSVCGRRKRAECRLHAHLEWEEKLRAIFGKVMGAWEVHGEAILDYTVSFYSNPSI